MPTKKSDGKLPYSQYIIRLYQQLALGEKSVDSLIQTEEAFLRFSKDETFNQEDRDLFLQMVQDSQIARKLYINPHEGFEEEDLLVQSIPTKQEMNTKIASVFAADNYRFLADFLLRRYKKDPKSIQSMIEMVQRYTLDTPFSEKTNLMIRVFKETLHLP